MTKCCPLETKSQQGKATKQNTTRAPWTPRQIFGHSQDTVTGTHLVKNANCFNGIFVTEVSHGFSILPSRWLDMNTVRDEHTRSMHCTPKKKKKKTQYQTCEDSRILFLLSQYCVFLYWTEYHFTVHAFMHLKFDFSTSQGSFFHISVHTSCTLGYIFPKWFLTMTCAYMTVITGSGGSHQRSSCTLCIGYRLRWRSDIWRTDRGVAEVRSPGIRPATEDDIRHNAPGLVETVHQLLRTKVRRKLLNQDKPSRLASYALQQHKAKSARLAASYFSFLLAVLRRSGWVRAVEQAWDENFETSASDGRAW